MPVNRPMSGRPSTCERPSAPIRHALSEMNNCFRAAPHTIARAEMVEAAVAELRREHPPRLKPAVGGGAGGRPVT
jgi:hypothetical protein